MTDTGIATDSISNQEAIAFLAPDPVGNVELLTALRYDADVRCIGARRSGEGAGLGLSIPVGQGDRGNLSFPFSATYEGQAEKPVTIGNFPVHQLNGPEAHPANENVSLIGILVVGREGAADRLTARIATNDPDALDALIAALPRNTSRIVVHRAWILPVLMTALRLTPKEEPDILFSLVTMPTLPTPGVRLLTMADAPMMAASATLWGRLGLVDTLRAGFRPFGIVRGARVVACAMAANVTAWTEEIMSVWTAPRHRNEGLATAVVAATAADIVARGKIAIYVAAVTNRASQRVAEKVGFQRAYDIAAYGIRR